MFNNMIDIKLISPKKGRGVVSKEFINKGTIIDIAHVILFSNHENDLINKTIINNYVFEWDDPEDNSEYKNALAMSFCEFLNHSYTPNVEYEKNFKDKTIKFYAIKDIQPEIELTINYNGKLDNKNPLWFDLE